jgi:hypothetical protein
MDKAQLAALVLGTTLLAAIAGAGPARADYDYPWCAQGEGYGYPGECAYATYEQCQASVSGRLLYCGPNPRFLFGKPPQPQPPRRSRPVYPNERARG